ncbi:cache domain-containing sensor histidine kinase [Enterococcus sp. LJL98]
MITFFRKQFKYWVRTIRKMTIFPRLFLFFSALLIIPTVFITFFNQYYYGKQAQSEHTRYSSILVQNASYKVEEQLANYEKIMLRLLSDQAVLNAVKENQSLIQGGTLEDSEQLTQFKKKEDFLLSTLTQHQKQSSGIKALLLLTEDTQYGVAKYDGEFNQTITIPNRSAFKTSQLYQKTVKANGYPVWLDSTSETSQYFFESTNETIGIIGCITLSYQIKDSFSKEPIGMVIACIYPTYFSQLLKEFSGSTNGNTFILGNQGLLEGINSSFLSPPFPNDTKNFKKMIFNTREGSMTLNNGQEKILVNYLGKVSSPFYLVNLTYKKQVFAQINQIRNTNLAILFLFLLIGLFGFYLVSSSVSRPVKKLIATTKKVGEGDFSVSYRPKSQDEIGQLCIAFDDMVIQTRTLINQVYLSEIKEKNAQLSEKSAQLDALQMQISPHFLYNTLDMIRWQALYDSDGQGKSPEMIEKFCQLLRMMTKGSQNKETIEESIQSAQVYLDVMNYRYLNKIKFKVDGLATVSTYLIPCFTIQPIIENTIKHAFPDKEESEKSIHISFKEHENQTLQIAIRDNGVGFDASKLAEIEANLNQNEMGKNNIGLKNVNQRCKLYYGDEYGLQLFSSKSTGTCILLTIPIERREKIDV